MLNLSYLGLSIGGSTPAAHAFLEFRTLFGGHLFPTLAHASPPMRAPAPVAVEAAEKNLAQDYESDRLPKSDEAQAKQCGHQPVPNCHDYKSEDNKSYYTE